MAISSPIFDIDRNDPIKCILVARIDLENSLYDLLRERAGMGTTGETYIVNEKALVLSNLRWHNNANLQLQIKTEPAINSSRGKTGILEADDYREKQVLAAYT